MTQDSATRELELCHGTAMLGDDTATNRVKLFHFLSIFHPELSLVKRLNLARDCSNNEVQR